jgi:hypothetical protein
MKSSQFDFVSTGNSLAEPVRRVEEIISYLRVTVVVISTQSDLFDRAVHLFDLAVSPEDGSVALDDLRIFRGEMDLRWQF